MANTLSVMIRNVVSKQRRRYTEGGFDLDLAYICHNIIAMGYPGEYIQGVFRNRMNDVCQFFEIQHPEHYKIYNLRSEKAYDVNKFHGRVSVYAFEDHNPPTIELIEKFCNDVGRWLNKDSDNVAAIHCKAGKGRTGTMICCYLLFSGIKTTAEEALAYYGEKRTMNKKGVTIPSQRRYVHYYARLIQWKLKYERRSLQLCEIRFSPAATLQSQGSVQCVISTMDEIDCSEGRTSKVHDIDSAGSWTKVTVKELNRFPIDFRKTFNLELDDQRVFVTGDVKVELKKQFHFWFNSYFVCNNAAYEGEGEDIKLIYTLSKCELDDAHKDKEHKLFPEDFKVQLVLKPIHPRNNADGSEITQLRHHNIHNNHVNSLTHNSRNNANMLLNQQFNQGLAAIPTSSKSGDPTLEAYHNLIPQPTPSVNPEKVNRSNNTNHNNRSHLQQQRQAQSLPAQQQQQQQQHTHHHHHHQHHLHNEQQHLQHQVQSQQQLQQQQPQQNTSSSNIHNTSSISNSSSSSISSQSTTSSSSAGVGGGGSSGNGGIGGMNEEEDWESGESSTTTTTTSTTTTTTTTPTTTSYFSYKRLISSPNDDDDDDNSHRNDRNDKNDYHDDDDDGVAKLSTSTTYPTSSTTTTNTTTTSHIVVTNDHPLPCAFPPPIFSPSILNAAQCDANADADEKVLQITTIKSKRNDIPDSLPLPISLLSSSFSTNGTSQAYSSHFTTPVKPRHMKFFNKSKCYEPSCSESNNHKSMDTTKCTTARSKFLKLINSQRFKAKTISQAMGSSLALNSGSASAVAQNQLLKKKKAKSKQTKTFQWLNSYFRTDPDFHENLSQQTTIPMVGRRNSAGSISSRIHLNSVGSASGLVIGGRAGSIEKCGIGGGVGCFRVGSLGSDGDEVDCQFVGLSKRNLLDKSSGAIKKTRDCPILGDHCSTVPPDDLKMKLSYGTSPVDKALRNVVDVGIQLSGVSPTRDAEFTYSEESNAATLLTKNNFRPDASNCDEKSHLPRVALGKLSLLSSSTSPSPSPSQSSSPPPSLPPPPPTPTNERTISIGSINSTSMDHLSVPYSNMYLQTQGAAILDEDTDVEVYHDHVDYYSSICDNQLSFNNSPCKSPRSLLDITDLKTAITHRYVLLKTEASTAPNAKATVSDTASSPVVVPIATSINNNSDGIVIAKPVESRSIGFNVDTSALPPPQTTEKYNMQHANCDVKSTTVIATPTRRKSPADPILNLIIIKSGDSSGGAVDVGDTDTDCGTTGDVSPKDPKANGSSSSSSGYCCASEGSSTSSCLVDTISSCSTAAFSLERNNSDGGGNADPTVVLINSKKKFSLPTPEIEVNEIGMTKNRSSSVSNNNNNNKMHSNIRMCLASSSSLLSSSSSSGSSIDNNDKH